MEAKQRSVLFMCFGNICRSPMAEALFREMVKKAGQSHLWKIDSAGIVDWNEGSQPANGTRTVLSENSVPVGNQHARKIEANDFYDFDFILSMDEGVMEELLKLKPEDSNVKVELLRQYHPKQEVIKDPYCGTKADFEKVFRQSRVCLTQFLESVNGELSY